MTIKFWGIIKDFWVSATKKEKIEIGIIPLIFSIMIFILMYNCFVLKTFEKIVTDFTNILVTISSILAAFGIASTTILLTSGGKNLEDAKNNNTERKKSNGHKINYFHLLLIRSFYNILNQIILLLVAILSSILLNFSFLINTIFVVELFLLFHSIGILILVITSMYHLMWPIQKNS